ncbi:dihydrofolate reductase [Sinorhizobium sp. RAC02]|uniref:dihydrofolate reductase n=1 Tax=Sinorhizobium sp. RAC02 TaxID=1842534 RepID=UPI00083E6BC3|nr:dihydrofolate reductase [Sinorhizobium sp. RAC02]AOF91805.1 dihydrofolate reductase family protein [Sinorhizobium sp. RAC02]
MSAAKIVLVVAVAKNGVIGRDGDLPWRLPSDLKRFKQLTLGKPVLMGRKTWASIGRPLPGRPNIVITRDATFLAPGADVVPSLEEGLAAARREAEKLGVDEICVIGGGQIYAQVFDGADVLHVTHVEADVDGDTRFPEIDPAIFEKAVEEPIPQGEKDSHAMRFVTWRRKTAA